MIAKLTSPEKKILRILRNSSEGRTITELVELSPLSRSTVRTALARLEGAEDISYRQIGMAKVYTVLDDVGVV